MAYSYRHSEAYMLMRYRSDDGTEEETLWNSRDGVTPSVIRLRSGKTASHVDWQDDTRMYEGWTPPEDMRYFVDLTPERARVLATRNVDRYLADPEMRDLFLSQFGSAENAVNLLAGQYIEVPGAPDIIDPLEHNADSST